MGGFECLFYRYSALDVQSGNNICSTSTEKKITGLSWKESHWCLCLIGKRLLGCNSCDFFFYTIAWLSGISIHLLRMWRLFSHICWSVTTDLYLDITMALVSVWSKLISIFPFPASFLVVLYIVFSMWAPVTFVKSLVMWICFWPVSNVCRHGLLKTERWLMD